MKLIEISVETDGEAAEAVSALFNRYGHGGTVTEEIHSGASHPPILRLKTFLSAEQSCAIPRIEQALWHLGQIYPMPPPSVRWLSETDWAEAWKADYKVQRIGQRIVVKPSWLPYIPTPSQVVVELDPGLAFGTGLHPSTRLTLEALERCLQPGNHVLDVGTGSGILAIAAAKLGARAVIALDTDGLALEVARENVGRNGVQDLVSLQRASLIPSSAAGDPDQRAPIFDVLGAWTGAFDLLLMNILADVIIRSAQAVSAALTAGGRFIVSGIIEPQEESVSHALASAGLSVLQRRKNKDWLALVGTKENRQGEAS